MSASRIALRWLLTLLAIGLAVVALMMTGVRLAMYQVDSLRDDINAQLTQQFDATMRLGNLNAALHGFDPSLTIGDLQLTSQAGVDPFPLLDIQQARAQLDVSESLLAGYPVFGELRITDATLHLYQDRHGRWSWPEPAELPADLMLDRSFEIEGFDHAIGMLLRQQAYAENIRLVLHGIHDTVTLLAPRLVMSHRQGQAHLEGRLFIEGEQGRSLEAVLEVQPEEKDVRDYEATFQARADLGALSRLGKLMTQQAPLRLDHVSGNADLWGFWHGGRMQDVRAQLSIEALALNGQNEPFVLRDLQANAQWLRGERDAWQAWFNLPQPDDESDSSLPIPDHLYAEGDNQGWLLRSGAFDIAALTVWLKNMPLSEQADRAIEGLAPSGHVESLEVGWRQQAWRGRALLRAVTVEPWQGAPGGGPFDAWIEGSDRQGQVTFSEKAGLTLSFPEMFEAPIALDRAAGKVAWERNENTWTLAGEPLAVQWRGADITGNFRLVPPTSASGEFALTLDMNNVDAINTPLMEWLPTQIIDPELREWLAGGIAGRVPHGSLEVMQRLGRDDVERSGKAVAGEEDEEFNGRLRMELQIEQGRLPYDPQWPALENVQGTLTVEEDSLSASVAHAETLGLVSEGAEVTLQNDLLSVQSPVNGSTQALLNFLAASPIEGMEAFSDWRSEGRVQGRMELRVPMGEEVDAAESEAFEVDVDASVDAPTLTFSQVGLSLGNVNGKLHYRHVQNNDLLTGELGARAFDGPLLARFDVGGSGVSLEGSALARGLLEWANMPELEPLLTGYFPYTAQLKLDDEPRLTLDSDLQGLAIQLPAPLGKRLDDRVPLHIEAILGERVNVDLAQRMRLRWRARTPEAGQGQVWLEHWPASPEWPSGPGWEFSWRTKVLPLEPWQKVLAGLSLTEGDQQGGAAQASSAIRRVSFDTGCLQWEQRCLGSLSASVSPLVDGWRAELDGSLAQGLAEYRPQQAAPLAVTLSQLHLDALLADVTDTGSTELLDQIATPPELMPLPAASGQLPDGRIRIDTLLYQGRVLGPLSADWSATPQRLTVAPLSLTLGEVTAAGEIVWESTGPEASLTRSRIALSGGDLGTMIGALGQPVPLHSKSTQVQTQLAWPGAPWQFALERSRGSLEAELTDGRFLMLESPSARLVGLLNVDNLLRRLRLDFSDVTGQGTAFDSVTGSATLYGGRLETRGPVEIDGPSTQFTLDGSVDLAARQLDLLLGITVPVSQNLPLAAVLVGAPYVGGALFLADKVFGGWIDKVTRIHYRVRGPWTSPQITLENAE